MPQVQVKTIEAEQVWQKGDMTIWKVVFDYNGQKFQAKTYSKAISAPGWSGTVETYEKEGRNGSETFVKQPQKEGGFQPRQGGGAGSYQRSAPQDQFTMYMSYAKDIAVALMDKTGDIDQEKFNTAIQAVIEGGQTLYEARPGAPATQTQEDKPTDDENGTDYKEDLDKMFGETQDITDGEKPWTPTATVPTLPV